MKTVIPEQKVVTCDICKEKLNTGLNYKDNYCGVIRIDMNGLTFEGQNKYNPPTGLLLDLCNLCSRDIVQYLDKKRADNEIVGEGRG